MKLIKSHRDLDVYRHSFKASMKIFEITIKFPKEERYSLTDQMRRSSRSLCANLAEAWRKRIYPAAFTAKINDSKAETCETQTWLDLSVACGYISKPVYSKLNKDYDNILGKLVNMRTHPEKWSIKK